MRSSWKAQLTSILVVMLVSSTATAAPKPIVLDSTYQHDRFNTQPTDIVRQFRAYTTSFDSGDDETDAWGIPEWVAYEIKQFEGECIPTKKRPKWFSDNDLVDQGIAPTDDSYKYSREWRSLHPDWYVRGHLAMKLIAERLGHDAAHNTHTMLNAVPQRDEFNSGIWLELEYLTAAWAQKYGAVWVITGPVVIDGQPSGWIGNEGEFPIAIPDALFKIVIKNSDDEDQLDVLAFLYPQIGPTYYGKSPYPHQNYLVSVDDIEELTGLDFLTTLSDDDEEEIEANTEEWLWSVDDENFLKACRN